MEDDAFYDEAIFYDHSIRGHLEELTKEFSGIPHGEIRASYSSAIEHLEGNSVGIDSTIPGTAFRKIYLGYLKAQLKI